MFLQINAEDKKDEDVYIMSDFVVTSKDDKGYYSASSTATGTNQLVKNTPINLSIIGSELLEDLGINTTEDLAQVSASIDTDPTSYSLDQIRIRGYRNIFTRYNGFRRTIPRDSYNISRIDIIKGANSLLFGEASPGGSVNAIPLRANFRKNTGSILFGFGNKGYNRKIFNYNSVLSDKLAFRLMAIDHKQGYEHDYKDYDLISKTFSFNYRPTNRSEILIHLEDVNSTFKFPTLAMRDKTYADDSDLGDGGNNVYDLGENFTDVNGNAEWDTGEAFDDVANMTQITNTTGGYWPIDVPTNALSRAIGYDGYLSVEDNVNSSEAQYYVPYNPEWVKFAPQELIDALISNTSNNIGPDSFNSAGSGIQINSRNDLYNYYKLINESNYGYVSGPDKYKDVDGRFLTAEYQHALNDSLEFRLAMNFQENLGNNLTRDFYGSNKVVDSFSFAHSLGGVSSFPRSHIHVYDGIDEDLNGNGQLDEGEDLDGDGFLNAPEPFIRTYWIKSEGSGERYGMKSQINWEKNILGVDNTFVFGWDYLDTDTQQLNYDQIPGNVEAPDGSYLGRYTYDDDGGFIIDPDEAGDPQNISRRLLWSAENRISYRERAYEILPLKNGFGPDAPGIRFDNIITNGFGGDIQTGWLRSGYDNDEGAYATDISDTLFNNDDGVRIIPGSPAENWTDVNGDGIPNGDGSGEEQWFDWDQDGIVDLIPDNQFGLDEFNDANGNGILDEWTDSNGNGIWDDTTADTINYAQWGLNTTQSAKVINHQHWFAAQSSFFNGKLRTLMGARLSKIQVKSSLRKVSLYGRKGENIWYNEIDEFGNPIIDETADIRFDNYQDKKWHKLSPSFGALYWINDTFALFGNYAESIEAPRGQSRTPLGTLPAPELGLGIEGGVRFSTLDNKIDGQIAYYSIEKENDDEYAYSNNLLSQIYPKYATDINGNFYPDDYVDVNGNGLWDQDDPSTQNIDELEPFTENGVSNGILESGERALTIYGENHPEIYWNNSGNIRPSGLPGRRGEGDTTISSGIEVDVNYNPSPAISFIGSFNKTLKNEVKKLHPLVTNPEDYRELFGRPEYRASLTGRYAFRNGKLKGLSCGLTQYYRSGGIQTYFKITDANGVERKYYLTFGDEYNTTGFISYRGKFSRDKNSPLYAINFRINNIFDNRDFIGRDSYGFYKESLSYNLSMKISF